MLGKTNHTKLIILIDPDKYNPELVKMANASKVYCFFVGGSKIKKGLFEKTAQKILFTGFGRLARHDILRPVQTLLDAV